MSHPVEAQKLSYAKSLLKKVLAETGIPGKSFDESLDKCRKILAYCENYRHYPGIEAVMEKVEVHKLLLIQLRDEWSEFREQEYATRLAKAEWLRQSCI